MPQYNKTFEPGKTETVNRSLVEVQTTKLVQGQGSIIRLVGYTNSTADKFFVTVISDQGSDRRSAQTQAIYNQGKYSGLPIYVQHFIKWYNNEIGDIDIPTYVEDLIRWFDVNVAPLAGFFIVFYAILFVIIYLYTRRRNAFKRFLSAVTNNIMEVRRDLLKDHTYKVKLSDVWSNMPINKRRHVIKDINDYLLIDDFYSQLERRNQFVEKNVDKKESDLSRANTLSKLNESLLAAAENALNKVNWNKYR